MDAAARFMEEGEAIQRQDSKRPLEPLLTVAVGVTTYTYDANGNQQFVELPDESRIAWDYEN